MGDMCDFGTNAIKMGDAPWSVDPTVMSWVSADRSSKEQRSYHKSSLTTQRKPDLQQRPAHWMFNNYCDKVCELDPLPSVLPV